MISPEYASHLGRTKIMIHCPPKRKRDRRPTFCGAAAPLWLAAPGRDGSPEASGGRSLRTWVWEFWVKPSDAGRGPAGPSSDCGLAARTRAGGWGAGWCPQRGSWTRALPQPPRARVWLPGPAGQRAEAADAPAWTPACSEPSRRGGAHAPPAAQTEGCYKHLQQPDKTVYCSSAAPRPRAGARPAWHREPWAPARAPAVGPGRGVFVCKPWPLSSATEISCLCYSPLQRDHLKPNTFIAPFKPALQLPVHPIPCPGLGLLLQLGAALLEEPPAGAPGLGRRTAGPTRGPARLMPQAAGSPRVQVVARWPAGRLVSRAGRAAWPAGIQAACRGGTWLPSWPLHLRSAPWGPALPILAPSFLTLAGTSSLAHWPLGPSRVLNQRPAGLDSPCESKKGRSRRGGRGRGAGGEVQRRPGARRPCGRVSLSVSLGLPTSPSPSFPICNRPHLTQVLPSVNEIIECKALSRALFNGIFWLTTSLLFSLSVSWASKGTSRQSYMVLATRGTFAVVMAPNTPICQGNKTLRTKCLCWIKELSKEGCLEEAGLGLKLEKQSGLTRGACRQAPGSRAPPATAPQFHRSGSDCPPVPQTPTPAPPPPAAFPSHSEAAAARGDRCPRPGCPCSRHRCAPGQERDGFGQESSKPEGGRGRCCSVLSAVPREGGPLRGRKQDGRGGRAPASGLSLARRGPETRSSPRRRGAAWCLLSSGVLASPPGRSWPGGKRGAPVCTRHLADGHRVPGSFPKAAGSRETSETFRPRTGQRGGHGRGRAVR